MGIVAGDGWEIVLKTSEHLLPKAQLLKCLRRRKKNQFLWEGRDVGMIFFFFFSPVLPWVSQCFPCHSCVWKKGTRMHLLLGH